MTSHESHFANERCDADAEDFQGGRIAQARGVRSSGAQASGVTSSDGGAAPVKFTKILDSSSARWFFTPGGGPLAIFFRCRGRHRALAGRWQGHDDRRTVGWVHQADVTTTRHAQQRAKLFSGLAWASSGCRYASSYLSSTVAPRLRKYFPRASIVDASCTGRVRASQGPRWRFAICGAREP